MGALDRFVLPGLALCIIVGVLVMAWLIYREKPVEKQRHDRPEPPKRARRKVL